MWHRCDHYAPFPRVRPVRAAASNRSGAARLMTNLDRLGEANRLSTNMLGRPKVWVERLKSAPTEAVRPAVTVGYWRLLAATFP